jgi:hypothetical protein
LEEKRSDLVVDPQAGFLRWATHQTRRWNVSHHRTWFQTQYLFEAGVGGLKRETETGCFQVVLLLWVVMSAVE